MTQAPCLGMTDPNFLASFLGLCSSATFRGSGSCQLSVLASSSTTQFSLFTQLLVEWEMAIHSSILAWKIPWTEEAGGLQSMGSVGHDWAHTHTHTHTHVAPRAASSSSFRLTSSRWPPSGMSGLHTSSIITPNTTNSKLKLYWKFWDNAS